MISKHIKPKPLNQGEKTPHYNYTTLANYVADSKHNGEKLHSFWMVNCQSGDGIESLPIAIEEIKSTQRQNTRAKGDKTYHLMVSFRKKDDMPSQEALEDIERHFAVALGFEEHERVIGLHKDTDNFHLHIAYNKVHPDTYLCRSPSWDYYKRENVCREMETKYGLSVDRGRADKEETSRVPTGASDMEAHRWEESFDSYVRGHKEELSKVIDKASNWQDVHKGFSEYDLELKKHGNGLVIASSSNKNTSIKASSIDRSFSKPKLESRFGAFQGPDPDNGKEKKARKKDSYKPKPTTKHPKQDRLWKKYQADRKAWHKGWKAFLFQLALVQDPLAIAIIEAQKRLIRSILPGAEQNTRAFSTVSRPKTKQREERYYLDNSARSQRATGGYVDSSIPRSMRERGKELGARWDGKQKRWYVQSKEELLPAMLLSVSAQMAREKERREKVVRIKTKRVYLDVPFAEKDKAKNAGAKWDSERKSWYTPSIKSARKVRNRTGASKSTYQQKRELDNFASSILRSPLLHQSSFSASTLLRATISKQLGELSSGKKQSKDKGLEL